MADNTQTNLGTGGDLIASDDVTTLNGGASSGVKVQRVKVGFGSDGSYRDVDATFPLPVYTPAQATYRASSAAVLVTAVTAAVPWFVIYGSATKKIRVQKIIVSGLTLTAVAYLNIGVAKYSTAPTGGTAVAYVKVPLDSTDAASTANLVQAYTAAPTRGTLVGFIRGSRPLGQATTAAAAGIPPEVIIDLRSLADNEEAILNGIAQGIGLEWLVAPATAVSCLVTVEYTEE